MKKFCLIGETLKHSYSEKIHKAFGKYDYSLVELSPNDLKQFVAEKKFDGFNVTIPYKQKIMEYLDVIDDTAKKINAINTVVYKDNKSYGYNTDILGMKQLLIISGIVLTEKVVLILGSGGTSHTARFLCESERAKEIITVSRSGEVNYETVGKYYNTCDVIINTTPIGMFPKVDFSPIDLSNFTKLSGVIDVIYNPEKTKLLCQAEKMNIKCIGGSLMLAAQAKYAMDLFLGEKFSDGYIDIALKEIANE